MQVKAVTMAVCFLSRTTYGRGAFLLRCDPEDVARFGFLANGFEVSVRF